MNSHTTQYSGFCLDPLKRVNIQSINPLTPNDPYRGRAAPLNSKR